MFLRNYLNAAIFIPLSLFTAAPGQWPDTVKIRVGKGGCSSGPIFQTQVVQTVKDRSKGLGGRQHPLSPEEGMLFVLEPKADGGFFWMKDTFIPLSLLYFDQKGKLLSSHEMPVEPDPSQPKRVYLKPDQAAAALEVAPGYANRFTPWAEFVLCIQRKP